MSNPEGSSASEPDLRSLGPDLIVDRLLGHGASADAYLAHDAALDIAVTVKLLRRELAQTAEGRARFEREGRAAANVVHPNVPAVLRHGTLPDGTPFLVVRHVHGRTLEERLAAEGPFTPLEARRTLTDVAAALAAAHQVGVVHRDVRPANILLEDATGRAMLTDFGIASVTDLWARARPARITRTGQVLGDSRYVSPEQLRGSVVTETSDVFSLAVVGYEMLTGERPFDAKGARTATIARMEGRPIALPPAVQERDERLAEILRRCLHGDPARRPSAATLVRWLNTDAPDEVDDWWTRTAHALRKGRVPQWIAGASAGAWLLLQAVDQLGQNELLPRSSYPVALATAVAAVAVAAVLAWFHGERGEQRFRSVEVLLLAAIVVAWITVVIATLT